MKNIIVVFALVFAVCAANAQQLPELKLKNNESFSKAYNNSVKIPDSRLQPKKRKAVNTYFGAGYSFVIFTDREMNTLYPVFNQSVGDFLSEINVFFGFAIAKAVTLEIEPSILFTNNSKLVTFTLNNPVTFGNIKYYYANTNHASMLAFPFAVNARFFPFFSMSKSFSRLFFIGGGAGFDWIREEYDVYFTQTPGIYLNGNYYPATISTSQWAPLFRVMLGFTGSGGMFGFGGEVRYNFVPLKSADDPFATRYSKNFNSVDISLRFYFGM